MTALARAKYWFCEHCRCSGLWLPLPEYAIIKISYEKSIQIAEGRPPLKWGKLFPRSKASSFSWNVRYKV